MRWRSASRNRVHPLAATLVCIGVGAGVTTLVGCGDDRRDRPADAGSGGDGGGGQGGAGGVGGTGGSGGAGGAGGDTKACTVGGTVGFAPTDFKDPVVHCRWGAGINVMTTPVVIDLNGDDKPEIAFPAYDGHLHAISGTDCSELWSVYLENTDTASDLAAGDLDGDGVPELVAVSMSAVVVYDGLTGAVRAKLVELNGHGLVAPAIANVDGIGPAEIIVNAGVYRFEGTTVSKLWNTDDKSASVGAAVDFEGDGIMEVVATDGIYDGVTGEQKVAFDYHGLVAVADLYPDVKGPEVVVANTVSGVRIHAGMSADEPGRILFGPFSVAESGAGGGGAPAVADFDGDGLPEVGVAGAVFYTVFDPDCDADPLPAGCTARGVRWRKPTQDKSSYMTTSTVFDFNCDGKAEVVYRDECWLRVYDGETGDVKFATGITSNTALEGAVVADVDGSGSAKIVIGANTIPKCPAEGTPEPDTGTPFGGLNAGIFILKDPMDRWAPTRRVWNQNGFHITNVDEKGAVPLKEEPFWTRDNTWRANEARTR